MPATMPNAIERLSTALPRHHNIPRTATNSLLSNKPAHTTLFPDGGTLGAECAMELEFVTTSRHVASKVKVGSERETIRIRLIAG